MPGDAAHGDTGWAGTGEPLCSALWDVSSSPHLLLNTPGLEHRVTDTAWPGAWPEPWPQPYLGSALRQHPQVSSLQGCSWGKGAAGAPLPPLPPLPCEPHSHQIHFSQAHQEVSILGDCGGQHRGAEDLKLTVRGSNPLVFLELPSFSFACLFISSTKCPVFPSAMALWMMSLGLGDVPGQDLCSSRGLSLLQLPPGPSSRLCCFPSSSTFPKMTLPF